MENDIKIDIWKIYYLAPIDNELDIQYIGLTKRTLKKRLINHKCCEKTSKVKSWLKSIDNQVIIFLIEDNILTFEEANLREIYWIKYYRELGVKLRNLTDGGDGSPGKKHSDKTKEKISKSNKGKKLSDATKKRMSESKNDEKNNMFGKNHSDETKEKISKNKIGKKLNLNVNSRKNNRDKLSKKVACYTLDGELVKIYESMISSKVDGFHRQSILKVCQGKQKTSKGYLWKCI